MTAAALTACVGFTAVGVSSSHAVTPNFVIETTYTATGPMIEGTVQTLNLTLTNKGTEDDPAGGFGWILVPVGLKRTNTPTTADPKVLCEAYRGHQGGLSASQFTEFCRVWFAGPIPAGGSVTLPFPVKALAAGDYTTVAEMTTGLPDASGYYPDLVRLTQDIHISPAPPKVGGDGGGTTTGLPDLQVSGKANNAALVAGGGSLLGYYFQAKNTGKVAATGVVARSVVPAGLVVDSATQDGNAGACSWAPDAASGGTLITCTFASPIAVGATAGITIGASGPTNGPWAVSASFAGDNGDSNLANNSLTYTVTPR